MGKFFYNLAMVTGIIVGTGPLWLCLGVVIDDLGEFFHYWVIGMVVSFITFFCSTILMQILP